MSVKPTPDGYHAVTPYIIVKGAAQAIDFYKAAFGATEIMRFPGPGGTVCHAEIKIGDSRIMLGDENPQWGAVGPQTLGGTPFGLCIYVPNVDERFAQAIAAGATAERPVKDQFYGDRSGTLVDPFGHKWTIATHVEDVSLEEMQRRMAALMPQPEAA